MEVYLDHAATTWCYKSVQDMVIKTMMVDYGNPSSMHRKGVVAEAYVKKARGAVARQLKVQDKEILFTSGGTESNNLALMGAAWANRRQGRRILYSAMEHAAVKEPMKRLEEQGFETVEIPVDEQGVLSMAALEEALTPETILVSVMYVNNEVGSVQPIEEIGRLVHGKVPKALFHVDAIQALGKYHIYPGRMGIDLLCASGHKIHGPKGVGFLYIRGQTKVQPQILGGGQQDGMRSGTDNVPGIAGLGAAVEEVYRDLDKKVAHMYRIKGLLTDGLRGLDGEAVIHGMPVLQGAPHIVNVSFPGIRSEVMLHALEDRGIYVSAGSACSTHKRQKKGPLDAMGVDKGQRESAVRFSFCEETTEEEIRYCLQVLKESIPILRRYARR